MPVATAIVRALTSEAKTHLASTMAVYRIRHDARGDCDRARLQSTKACGESQPAPSRLPQSVRRCIANSKSLYVYSRTMVHRRRSPVVGLAGLDPRISRKFLPVWRRLPLPHIFDEIDTRSLFLPIA